MQKIIFCFVSLIAISISFYSCVKEKEPRGCVAPAAPTAYCDTPVTYPGTISLHAGGVSNATYNWTGPANFIYTGADPRIENVSTANMGEYTVSAVVNGCSSAATSVKVTGTPLAAPCSSPVGVMNISTGTNVQLDEGTATDNQGSLYITCNGFGGTFSCVLPYISQAKGGIYDITTSSSFKGTANITLNTGSKYTGISGKAYLIIESNQEHARMTLCGASFKDASGNVVSITGTVRFSVF